MSFFVKLTLQLRVISWLSQDNNDELNKDIQNETILIWIIII
jgi:hypothetical protein